MATSGPDDSEKGKGSGWVRKNPGKVASGGLSLMALLGMFWDLNKTVVENHNEVLREFRALDNSVHESANAYTRQLSEQGIQVSINSQELLKLSDHYWKHISSSGHKILKQRVNRMGELHNIPPLTEE